MKRKSVIWKIDKKQLEDIVKNSNTISDVLKYFGLKNIGGNYITLKNRLHEDGIDYSHIALGKDSNKGKKFKPNAIPLDKILVEKSTYKRQNLKQRLIKNELLEYKCAVCHMLPIWNDKILALELDHINGVSDDNRLFNLRFICPNCHSQTPTHAGKNKKHQKIEKTKIQCKECGEPKVSNKLELCLKCVSKKRRKVIRPTKEELQVMLWEKPTIQIAKQYNITDNAVAKWAKNYGLSKPSPGYWTKLKYNCI